MGKIYEYKSIDLGFKDIDTKAGIVTGYFASFNTVDAENDVMLPGAFDKTIKENFNRIKHLLDHDTRNVVGKLQILEPDQKGLYYESKAGSHAKGQDFLKMAIDGIITEHSFGYQIPKGKATVKEGVRYISEVKMYEGSSLQAWGMNENTPLVGVKTLYQDPEKVAQRMKALEAFCRNSDATDETIELLLIEAKQLSQLLIDLTAKDVTVPVPATQPIATDWAKVAMAIQLL
jgi:HK97 family phage prohead protease